MAELSVAGAISWAAERYFGAKAADYVDVFVSAINWPAVEQFYDRGRP